MKQPQFNARTLHTPLWLDNAERLLAHDAALRARIHRIAFPFLLTIFACSVVRLVVWINSLP
jgi:hypothetical protein